MGEKRVDLVNVHARRKNPDKLRVRRGRQAAIGRLFAGGIDSFSSSRLFFFGS